jgi:DNA-binding MarR family transcriptional regulator
MNKDIDTRLIIFFSDMIKAFYQNKSEQLSMLNVKGAHCKMLHLIYDHNGQTQQEILKIANITKSTMSEVITEMEKEGFIEKIKSKDDKRQILILLTPKGESIAKIISDYYNEYCLQFMSDFTVQEINQFMKLLAKIKY